MSERTERARRRSPVLVSSTSPGTGPAVPPGARVRPWSPFPFPFLHVDRRWPLLVLTALTFVVYTAYAVSRHQGYLTAGYDLGIFDQAVRDYARFRAPIVPLRGPDLNIWADHAHPVIALAAPLYWLWDSPVTLLVLQAGLVASSLPFVHAFARRRVGAGTALAITAGYAAGWPLQGLIDFDFHEIAFGIPLLAAAVDALDRRSDRALLISSGMLLTVREDLGVVVAVFGLLRVLQGGWALPGGVAPFPRRWVGGLMIGAGTLTYLLLTAVVIPSFAPDGHFAYWTFDSLGPDLPGAIAYVLTHPWQTLALLVVPATKAQTWLYLLVPLALLPLRSRYVLVALPLLAERFLNSRENLWTTHFHYNALPWVVLALAMVDGAARLGIWSRPMLRRAVVAWLLLVPVWLSAQDSVTPQVFRRLYDGTAWASGAHLQAQQAAVAQVPAGVCVAVDDRLAPHLTARDRVTLPGIGAARTDYVVLDFTQREVGSTLEGPLETPGVAFVRLRAEGFVETFRQEDVVVLRAPTYAGPTPACRP